MFNWRAFVDFDLLEQARRLTNLHQASIGTTAVSQKDAIDLTKRVAACIRPGRPTVWKVGDDRTSLIGAGIYRIFKHAVTQLNDGAYHTNKRYMYIGYTSDFHARLLEHQRYNNLFEDEFVDLLYAIPKVSDKNMLRDAEELHIGRHTPSRNTYTGRNGRLADALNYGYTFAPRNHRHFLYYYENFSEIKDPQYALDLIQDRSDTVPDHNERESLFKAREYIRNRAMENGTQRIVDSLQNELVAAETRAAGSMSDGAQKISGMLRGHRERLDLMRSTLNQIVQSRFFGE